MSKKGITEKVGTEKVGQTLPADILAMSFEVALKELESIVARLEGGRVDLEESLGIYERGSLLKAHCEAKLRDAAAKVEKIVLAADGAVITAPADI